jgi:hypothetical protein
LRGAPEGTAMNVLTQGDSGLWFLIDTEHPGVFIAAPDPDQALSIADAARRCLPIAEDGVPLHTLHDHAAGARVTVPDPHWMTPAQMTETYRYLRNHLRERVLS